MGLERGGRGEGETQGGPLTTRDEGGGATADTLGPAGLPGSVLCAGVVEHSTAGVAAPGTVPDWAVELAESVWLRCRSWVLTVDRT